MTTLSVLLKVKVTLCPECDEFHFPRKSPGQSKCSVIADSKSGTARSNKLIGKTGNNKQKGKMKSTRKNSHKAAAAAADSDVDSENELPSIHCASCMNTIDTNCAKVPCSICCGLFHLLAITKIAIIAVPYRHNVSVTPQHYASIRKAK